MDRLQTKRLKFEFDMICKRPSNLSYTLSKALEFVPCLSIGSNSKLHTTPSSDQALTWAEPRVWTEAKELMP